VQIKEEAPEEHLPGLLPHEYAAWASRDPSHTKHYHPGDAYKVTKSTSCRTTVWMSAIGTKQTSILTLNMSAFGGKADIPDPLSNVR
jgi:hypothetical protein